MYHPPNQRKPEVNMYGVMIGDYDYWYPISNIEPNRIEYPCLGGFVEEHPKLGSKSIRTSFIKGFYFATMRIETNNTIYNVITWSSYYIKTLDDMGYQLKDMVKVIEECQANYSNVL